MNNESTTETSSTHSADQATSEVGIIDELLIEEISIDGMCGVY